jgi:hypothetical protein
VEAAAARGPPEDRRAGRQTANRVDLGFD